MPDLERPHPAQPGATLPREPAPPVQPGQPDLSWLKPPENMEDWGKTEIGSAFLTLEQAQRAPGDSEIEAQSRASMIFHARQAQADAARYRFLRDHMRLTVEASDKSGWLFFNEPHEFEAHVDQAMSKMAAGQ